MCHMEIKLVSMAPTRKNTITIFSVYNQLSLYPIIINTDELVYDCFDVFDKKRPRIEQEHLVIHQDDDGIEALKSARQ